MTGISQEGGSGGPGGPRSKFGGWRSLAAAGRHVMSKPGGGTIPAAVIVP